MKLTAYSKVRLMESASQWEVDKDFFEPIFNWLVYGWSPGSFFTCLLANDFFNAVQSSHPANTMAALKKLCGWIRSDVPAEAWGSYDNVKAWGSYTDGQRRSFLERAGLIYTEREEVELALRGVEPSREPVFW